MTRRRRRDDEDESVEYDQQEHDLVALGYRRVRVPEGGYAWVPPAHYPQLRRH